MFEKRFFIWISYLNYDFFSIWKITLLLSVGQSLSVSVDVIAIESSLLMKQFIDLAGYLEE